MWGTHIKNFILVPYITYYLVNKALRRLQVELWHKADNKQQQQLTLGAHLCQAPL